MSHYERVVAEINLDAMAQNIQNIKMFLNPNTQLIAVVKADGYGHGALETARVALENGAAMLGVAIFDEAMQMRKHGISNPIIILGHTPESFFADILEHDITLTVFSYEPACMLAGLAKKMNKTAHIHIKIDSGMGRIGFLPSQQALDEITAIHALPNVSIDGYYTHLSEADAPDKAYTYQQRDIFFNLLHRLRQNGVPIPLVHLANSAALSDMRQFHYDAVRAGIILYGLSPFTGKDAPIPLVPVMSLKSRISFVKELPADSCIGYGRTYRLPAPKIIATIPVGYADGYMRALSNHGRVLIGGQFAPIVGQICMDQFMADVTHIPQAHIGSEVVMIGEQNGQRITADELAVICHTISWEIICAVGKRVPRAYIKNNSTVKTLNYLDYV